MRQRTKRTLSQLLAIQMALVAFGVSFALIALTIAFYVLDKPLLRRLTLEMQLRQIVAAMSHGDNPATWDLYKNYPRSYGFRVFDHRRASERRMIGQANPELLRSFDTGLGTAGAHGERDLASGVTSIPGLDTDGDGEPDNVWLITDRGEVGDRIYWVQAAMVDDPAAQWRSALSEEVVHDMLIPTLIIVPALMLAVHGATRRALRPLTRIARQAGDIGSAVASGRPFTPLSAEGLPLEFDGVVAGINATLAKLDHSLTLQKEFTSDVAHQLRTPLSVLQLETSALSSSPARDRIQQELGELTNLVNELLGFAQAEEAMSRRRNAVDLAGTARNVCEDLAGSAFQAEKQIEFDAPDQAVVVSGHRALLDAAIRNIVDNAIKLSPPRSTISVSVDAKRSIIVEDRGPGVPDAQKELIFERFWRAADRRSPGYGIGLALVRRITLLHGGDVHVEDRPGGGARFVMTFATARGEERTDT